jgi:peroxiredoxin
MLCQGQITPWLRAVMMLVAVAIWTIPSQAALAESPADLDRLLRELSVRPVWGEPPGLVLSGLDGRRYALEGLRGRVVLLYFWATWCPICTGELPSRIESLHREFQDRGLVVLAISMRESTDAVAAWLKRHPISPPVLLDSDGTATDAYRATTTPTFVLLDRSGQLVGRGAGPREWTGDSGRALIRALLGSP